MENFTQRRRSTIAVFLLLLSTSLSAPMLHAETCIAQSQMKPVEREAIASTARNLAAIVQANDAPALRQQTLPEYAKDPAGMASLVGNTAPKVKAATLQVDQVYLLDASTLKTLGDGINQDAQFFCSLNNSMAEASFLIPALPAGRYAFAMVTALNTKSPFRLSFLLKQNSGPEGNWSMAGFYPKPLTAAGHDGIWYWTNARDLVKRKQPWTAYLYYLQAEALLQPAGFVSSTHFDNLLKEAAAAVPANLSEGISPGTPLVVKGLNGNEYRFTSLATDDSFGADLVDIVAHLAGEPTPDPSSPKSGSEKPSAPAPSPRDRNVGAMAALLAAYPELRSSFHGVWIFAESPNGNPFVTEEPMANIH